MRFHLLLFYFQIICIYKKCGEIYVYFLPLWLLHTHIVSLLLLLQKKSLPFGLSFSDIFFRKNVQFFQIRENAQSRFKKQLKMKLREVVRWICFVWHWGKAHFHFSAIFILLKGYYSHCLVRLLLLLQFHLYIFFPVWLSCKHRKERREWKWPLSQIKLVVLSEVTSENCEESASAVPDNRHHHQQRHLCAPWQLTTMKVEWEEMEKKGNGVNNFMKKLRLFRFFFFRWSSSSQKKIKSM